MTEKMKVLTNYSDPTNSEDPNFMPGASCSLAAELNVEPEDLGTVVDTAALPTYTETQD